MIIAINAADVDTVIIPVQEYAHHAIPVGVVQIVPKKLVVTLIWYGTGRVPVFALPVGLVKSVTNAADMEAAMMPIREYAHSARPDGVVQQRLW